jgi:hypothetical protein
LPFHQEQLTFSFPARVFTRWEVVFCVFPPSDAKSLFHQSNVTAVFSILYPRPSLGNNLQTNLDREILSIRRINPLGDKRGGHATQGSVSRTHRG